MAISNPRDKLEESYTTREFLKGSACLGFKYFFAAHSILTAANIWRQKQVGEFSPFAPGEEAHDRGIDAYLEGNADINLYVLGDDSLGDVQRMEHPEKEIESYSNSISDRGSFHVKSYPVDLGSELEEVIEDNDVKDLDNKGSDALKKIESCLEEQYGEIKEDDFNFLVGDFETEWGHYKGHYVGDSYSAVCNSGEDIPRTDVYVGNQVLHNIGHMMGISHASFMPFYDQMSWGVMKEARAQIDLVPFGPESRDKFKEYTD